MTIGKVEGVITPQFWELKEDYKPKNERVFLEALRELSKETASREDINRFRIRLMQTVAPDREAEALQEALFAKYSDIFSVTVTVGSTSGQVHFQNLAKLDVHLMKNFQLQMREAATGQIVFAVPEIDTTEEELAAAFFQYMEQPDAAISGNNVISLLQFAVQSGLDTLCKSCVDYIITNGSFDDLQVVQYLVDFIDQCDGMQAHLGKLKCFIFNWVRSMRESPEIFAQLRAFDEEATLGLMALHSANFIFDYSKGEIELRSIWPVEDRTSLVNMGWLFGEYVTVLLLKGMKCRIANCYFPNLVVLDASDSSITHACLESLSRSGKNNIKTVIIDDTAISSFSGCLFPNATKVSAERTRFTNAELKTLSSACPNLQELSLKGCPITSFEGCTGFHQLRKLNVLNVPLSKEGRKTVVTSYKSLQRLAIGCRYKKEDKPVRLDGIELPNLQALLLFNVEITSQFISAMSQSSGGSLKKLTLERCHYRHGADFPPSTFSQLEELTLTDSVLEESWITALCRTSSEGIKKLTLTCVDIADAIPEVELERYPLSRVTDLTISLCKRREFDPDMRAELEKFCSCTLSTLREGLSFENTDLSSLRSLHVTNCLLDADQLQHIARTSKNTLEKLALHQTKLASLQDCAFAHLRELSLSKARIVNEDLQAISRANGESLTSIKLHNCYGISTFEQCNFPNVREVELVSTNLTNAGLQAVHRACKNLPTLVVKDNKRVTSTL